MSVRVSSLVPRSLGGEERPGVRSKVSCPLGSWRRIGCGIGRLWTIGLAGLPRKVDRGRANSAASAARSPMSVSMKPLCPPCSVACGTRDIALPGQAARIFAAPGSDDGLSVACIRRLKHCASFGHWRGRHRHVGPARRALVAPRLATARGLVAAPRKGLSSAFNPACRSRRRQGQRCAPWFAPCRRRRRACSGCRWQR